MDSIVTAVALETRKHAVRFFTLDPCIDRNENISRVKA
jgi:hypothetical protein